MNKNQTPKPERNLSDAAKYVCKENIKRIFAMDKDMTNYFKGNALDAAQSFALIFVALPANLLSIYLQFSQTPFAEQGITFQLFGLIFSLGFMMHHSAYYLILSYIAKGMNQWVGYLKYIQIRNLFITSLIVIESIVVILTTLFSLPDTLYISVSFFLGLYAIFVQYVIIRQCFNSSIGFTIGLLALDFFLNVFSSMGLIAAIFQNTN